MGPQNIEMLSRGVEESGIGLLMSGGWESFGGHLHPGWDETSIGRLLPTNELIDSWIDPGGKVVIDRPGHEFISSIPWDPGVFFMKRWDHNLVTVKQGAELLAHAEGSYFVDHPLIVTWSLEGGARVFASTGDGDHLGTWIEPEWEYCRDFGSNLAIYLARREVPQDINLVHLVRSRIFEINTRRSLLLNLLEFCETFSANTQGILSRVGEVDDVIDATIPQFLDLRFQDVLETYELADMMLEKLEEDAVQLKNRVLTWVYVVEWLFVTAISMLSGIFLWTVMVRRKVYKEVVVTRLGAR